MSSISSPLYTRSRARDVAISAVIAVLFCFITLKNGFPALRHDWNWPYTIDAINSYLRNELNGWVPDGIGHAHPNLNQYLIAICLAAPLYILGGKATLALLLFTIAFGISYFTLTLFRNASASWLGIGAAVFAVFNTWTFTEVVAGHVQMLLGLAAGIGLLAELLREKTRPHVVAALLLVALSQLQFFIIDFAGLVILAIRRRELRAPLLLSAIAATPIVLGLAFDGEALAGLPYRLVWEAQQSVRFTGALLLQGYFTHYEVPLTPLANTGLLALLIAAIASSFRPGFGIVHRSRALTAVLLALVTALAAAGLKGPLAPVMRDLIENVRPFAVFRELYDLCAYILIAYLLFGSALRDGPWARPFVAIGVLCLLSAWIQTPPGVYWVAADILPNTQIHAQADSRFALFPAFQPLRFRGRGSGLDPDAHARRGNVTPVNGVLGEYPTGPALALYEQSRNTSLLAALSVSEIVQRPDYSSDVENIRGQYEYGSSRLNSAPIAERNVRLRQFTPEMSIAASEPRISDVPHLGTGALFFADATGTPPDEFNVPKPTSETLDPNDGWIDARILFNALPDVAQPFGGIATRSRVPVTVPAPTNILYFTRGKLIAGANTAYNSGGVYRWQHIDHGSLSCDGLCVIAAFDSIAPPVTRAAARVSYAGIVFHIDLPWLVSVSLPATPSAATLRYNTAFDSNWVALEGLHPLPHIRLDALVNGWRIAQGSELREIRLVHTVSAAQFTLMIAAIAAIVVYFARAVRFSRRSS